MSEKTWRTGNNHIVYMGKDGTSRTVPAESFVITAVEEYVNRNNGEKLLDAIEIELPELWKYPYWKKKVSQLILGEAIRPAGRPSNIKWPHLEEDILLWERVHYWRPFFSTFYNNYAGDRAPSACKKVVDELGLDIKPKQVNECRKGFQKLNNKWLMHLADKNYKLGKEEADKQKRRRPK